MPLVRLCPGAVEALDALDPSRLVEDLQALVRIPSVGGTVGEEAAQSWMSGALRDAGLEVDRWPLDLVELSRHPQHSAEVERDEVTGVVGLLGDGEGPTLVLNGHVDVVPQGDLQLWTVDPFAGVLQEGRVWGRGAADMKGGLAAALAAARALQTAGVGLRGRLRIQSVVGEEDGGVGTLASILRGHVGDAAVVLEPTRLAVVPAGAGSLNVRITVRGRGAHGALRHDGVSALEAFRPVHDALLALEAERNARGALDPRFPGLRHPVPLSLGVVRGGVWPSSVMDSLVVEGRYGVLLDESLDEARGALEQAVAAAAARDPWLREHPPEVEWWGGCFEPAALPPDHPLPGRVLDAFRAANPDRPLADPPFQGVPYGSDQRLLMRVGGVPTVLFGPGDIRLAHGPDESVPVDELVAAARTLVVLITAFCGVE